MPHRRCRVSGRQLVDLSDSSLKFRLQLIQFLLKGLCSFLKFHRLTDIAGNPGICELELESRNFRGRLEAESQLFWGFRLIEHDVY